MTADQQLELPLFHGGQRQHGDTTTCRRCGKTLTYGADRALPYWSHPNRFPFCKAADGTVGPAEVDERL